MLTMKRIIASALLLVFTWMSLTTVGSAANVYVDPFPIGIYCTPAPENTTTEKYREIKELNANFVVMTNGNDQPEQGGAILQKCAENGLKALVADRRLTWNLKNVMQETTGSGKYVSQGNSLGQSFKTPAGTGWGLNKVTMYIDKDRWPADVTLTLRIYDSTMTTLVGEASIKGPVTTNYPEFEFHKLIQPDTEYYMELTSDSTYQTGWVVCSITNQYADGAAFENRSPKAGYDFWFKIEYGQRMYNDNSKPSVTDLDAIVNYYKNHQYSSALLGYEMKDEPGVNMMPNLRESERRIAALDPERMTFTNLFPTYSTEEQQGFKGFSGDWVTPVKAIGQTIRTNSKTNKISTIQLYIDKAQWSTNEPLTLKLWDSVSKNTVLGQCTLSGATTYYPEFTINADVTPNTNYYMELTHGGGGDNSVGWVVTSNRGVNWDGDGTLYVGGIQRDADLWFAINQNIVPFSYEDYVYRWASKDPDVIAYDHYVFHDDGSMSSGYFENMEIIRRQALRSSIDFWTYIQSVGIGTWLRNPTQGDITYHVFTSLAYGARGIIYFTYETPYSDTENFKAAIIKRDGTKNESYAWVQNINAQVLKLGPTLKTLTSKSVYHTGTLPAGTTALPSDFFFRPNDMNQSLVIGYFENSSGRKYVMVANRDVTNSRTVTFTLPEKPSTLKEVSKVSGNEENTNYNNSTGEFSASFAPGEGRLFVLP